MLSRVENRSSNPYGKTEAERAEIIDNYKNVLPLLYRRATLVIDTTNISVSQVAEEILALLKDA
jgi:RNase adaptor protein for sRNA GlmZ degradation